MSSRGTGGVTAEQLMNDDSDTELEDEKAYQHSSSSSCSCYGDNIKGGRRGFRYVRLQQAFCRIVIIGCYLSFIVFAVQRVQYVLTNSTDKVGRK